MLKKNYTLLFLYVNKLLNTIESNERMGLCMDRWAELIFLIHFIAFV